MDSLVLVALLLCGIYLAYKNTNNLLRYRKEKAYVTLYSDLLKNVEGAVERIDDYVEKTTDVEYKAKAQVIQLYAALTTDNQRIKECLDKLDYYDILFKGNAFDGHKATANSDSFIWTIMIMARARQLSMPDVVIDVFERLNKYEEDLQYFVEYQAVKGAYECLMEKNGEGVAFLKKLIVGEYEGYRYDKRLIGIYKRMGATMLAYVLEPIDDDYRQDLFSFALTLLGERLMKDLGIYEHFHEEQPAVEEAAVEETEEDVTEESEEVSEAKECE